MTLFTDDIEPRRPRRGSAILWVAVFLLVGIVGIAAFAPSPYVVEKPGPVYDTLGDVTVDDSSVPLIDIPSEKTYPTTGSLDMLTVTISGDRESPESWLDVAVAALNPRYDILDVDTVYPKGQTVQQSNDEAAVEMQNSQQEAIAAALHHLGYTFPSQISVQEVVAGMPSEGVLEAGDIIRTFDGTAVTATSALKDLIAQHGTTTPATIGIERGGAAMDVQVTPTTSDGDTIIGVQIAGTYDFPIDVQIQLQNVGGPSAGQMFALGIIDKLTDGSLTGGADVAGTGTIDADGTIGPIGGIRQKMWGAVDAGATYFLAPASNCDEVVDHVPSGLQVIAVSSLDDSVAALDTIADKGDVAALPTCAAS